jgi:hypothetical protein
MLKPGLVTPDALQCGFLEPIIRLYLLLSEPPATYCITE